MQLTNDASSENTPQIEPNSNFILSKLEPDRLGRLLEHARLMDGQLGFMWCHLTREFLHLVGIPPYSPKYSLCFMAADSKTSRGWAGVQWLAANQIFYSSWHTTNTVLLGYIPESRMVYFLLFPLNFSSYISGPLRALGSFSYWPRGKIVKRVILGAGTCVIQQWSELAL